MRWVFRALALAFVSAALFHAAAIVHPAIAEPSPAWRHGVFVGVNLAVAAGLWGRPRWFVVAFAALAVQQLVSHGQAAMAVWELERRIDFESAVVLIGVPLVLALLVIDVRSRSRSPG